MTEMRHATLTVEGMHCAGCAGRVERAVAALPGVESASVNLVTRALLADFAAPADMPGIAASVRRAGYGVPETVLELQVEGLTCAACTGRAERAVAVLPGVTGVSVNLVTGVARVVHLAGAVSEEAVMQALKAAGYPARAVPAGPQAEPDAQEARALRGPLLLAALLTLPLVVVEMGGHLVPALHHALAGAIGEQRLWAVEFVLATLVLAFPGRVFLQRGIPALFRGAPDMDALVVLGTLSAWGYSTLVTFAPGLFADGARAVYFEAAAVIVTLILLGRMLEARAKGQAGAAIRRLVGLQPPSARVLRPEGPVDVAVGDLRPGDRMIVRPGERIAADGLIEEGTSLVDCAMLTGEPAPQALGPGDRAVGGTVNGAGALVVRLTHTGAQTTLARIVRLVREAQGGKLPVQALVDQVTRWFVPAVLGIAAVTVMVWLVFDPAQALVAGVSVLIIACPCAMGLATPTSILVGTGRAAELGLLFRKGAALQDLAAVQAVVFDKTGTLTEGKSRLVEVRLAESFERADVLGLVAAVETRSEHPLAQALGAEPATPGEVTAFQVRPGLGVSALVGGRAVAVGSAAFMTDLGIATAAMSDAAAALAGAGRTVVFAACDGQLAALLAVADPLRPGAAAALADLRARGLSVAMISGDAPATAQAVAAVVGIERVAAGVLPEGKVAALAALRKDWGRVAFVGDGINDAPALAAADVGIAVGTGTDVAIETADLVLMAGDPKGVVRAIDLSRATLRNIRQNLGWAFGYNAVLIPVAAGALVPFGGPMLSPMLAAGAMALSSVLVVGNALRLRRAVPT